MSQSANIADAIIALDKAIVAFHRTLTMQQKISPEYQELRNKMETLSEEATVNHFDSIEEARHFRDCPYTFAHTRDFCGYQTCKPFGPEWYEYGPEWYEDESDCPCQIHTD